MLNSYDHEDAEPLVESVKEQLPVIVDLRRRAEEAGALGVYGNHNTDSWEAGGVAGAGTTTQGGWGAGGGRLSEGALGGKPRRWAERTAPREPVPFLAK